MVRAGGYLRKLRVQADDPVSYALPVGGERLPLNPLLGGRLRLRFTGVIRCIACARETRKSFNQGYCYPCFARLARCDLCIVSPERCHFHAGTCREPEWGLEHCMQPHLVYIANSSGVKVGITRASHASTRWIDQGATQALPMLEVSSRRHSGRVEAVFRAHVSDRTDWRRMLKRDAPPVDLIARRDALLARCREALASTVDGHEAAPRALPEAEVSTFRFPVLAYPRRIQALNPHRTPSIEGRLLGIKGQYLILDNGVLNVRRYAGYEARLECEG